MRFQIRIHHVVDTVILEAVSCVSDMYTCAGGRLSNQSYVSAAVKVFFSQLNGCFLHT